MTAYGHKEFVLFAHGNACPIDEEQVINIPPNICVIMNCTNTRTNMTAYRMCKLIKHMVDSHRLNNHNLVNNNFNDEYFKRFLAAQFASIITTLATEDSVSDSNTDTPFCLFYEKCPNVTLQFTDNINKKFQPGIFELPVQIEATKPSTQSIFFASKSASNETKQYRDSIFFNEKGEYFCDTLKEHNPLKQTNNLNDEILNDMFDSTNLKQTQTTIQLKQIHNRQENLTTNSVWSGLQPHKTNNTIERVHEFQYLQSFIQYLEKNTDPKIFKSTFYIITAVVCRGGKPIPQDQRLVLRNSNIPTSKITRSGNYVSEQDGLHEIVESISNKFQSFASTSGGSKKKRLIKNK